MSESIFPLTLESHLSSFQSLHPVYRHLYDTWQIAKMDIPKILHNIILAFPHYSKHDESHSEMIIRQIESILGVKRIEKLQPTETWLILMSAYTHDLGMLVRHDELCQEWKSPQFLEYLQEIMEDDSRIDMQKHAKWFFKEQVENNKVMPDDWPIHVQWAVVVLSAEYFRRRHPERGKKMIWDESYGSGYFKVDFSFNKFIPERLVKLIGDIAFCHGQSFKNIFNLKKRANGVGLASDIIYSRRVAALLRLGDLLDMDNGRFDENAYCLYGDVPNITLENRNKHAAITHFLVTENIIEVSVDCPTEGSFEIASQWLTWLKDEITNLSLYWNDIVSDDFGTAPTLIQPEIKLNGKFLQGDSLRHFDFSDDAVFELLVGANIYSNKFSCIRELIQNALDASKFRLWNQIQCKDFGFEDFNKASEEILPFNVPSNIYKQFKIILNIKYIKDEDGYEVSIADRGVGISTARLHQIGQVANSWYAQKEQKRLIKEMPLWLRPTGEFGIGIQSVFRLTDKLKCVTYSEQELPKEIIFRSKSSGGKISCQEIKVQSAMRVGSTFSFFIPVKAFDKLKYSWGDRVDVGINTSDPFRMDEYMIERYLYVFYLVECVKNDVGRDLFPIQIKVMIDNESYEEELCSLEQYSCLKDATTIDENLFVSLDILNGQILAYDSKYAISFNLNLNSNQRKAIFTFKGVYVRFDHWDMLNRIHHFAFNGTIGLNGFSSKKYLTLNREKLKEENELEISSIVYHDIESLIIHCYSSIDKFESKQNIKTEVWVSLASFYQMVRQKDASLAEVCKQHFFENLTSSLPCYIMEDNNYTLSSNKVKIFLKDIFNNNTFYVFESHSIFSDEKLLTDRIYDTCRHCNMNEEIKIYNKDIVDNFIDLNESYLLNVYCSENSEEDFYIYEYRIDANENNAPLLPTITDYLKKRLYVQLIKQPRMLTLALKNYEAIALKKVPHLIAWSRRRTYSFTNHYKNQYFIITPFIDTDLKLICANISKEKLWQQIEKREDFLRLVDYVYENNINISKIHRDDIVTTYHNWINEILSIVYEKS